VRKVISWRSSVVLLLLLVIGAALGYELASVGSTASALSLAAVEAVLLAVLVAVVHRPSGQKRGELSPGLSNWKRAGPGKESPYPGRSQPPAGDAWRLPDFPRLQFGRAYDGVALSISRWAIWQNTHLKLLAWLGPPVLVVAAGLAPLYWPGGLFIKSVDSFFSLHPQGHTAPSMFAWDARSSAGVPASDTIAIGINGLQEAGTAAGLSLQLTQSLILSGLALSAAWGMYRLVLLLAPEATGEAGRRLAAMGAAIAWIANPFALSFVWFHQLLTEVTWASLPWLVYLLFRGITGRSRLRLLLPALVLVMVASSGGYPHVYLPALAAIVLGTGIAAVLMSAQRRAALGRAAACAAALFVAIAWWLLPSLSTVQTLLQKASVGPSSLDEAQFAAQYSTLDNVITMTAEPALHQTLNGVPYMSWADLLTGSAGNVLRFVLPSIAVVGIVWAYRRKAIRPLALVAGVLLVVGVFISKGLAEPLAAVNKALVNLPLGEALRHPVDKLAPLVVLPVCILFAFGVIAIMRGRLGIPLSIVLVALVGGWLASPWWSGSVIPEGGGILPSARVAVPASYNTAGNLLAGSAPGGKTMVLPFSRDGQTAYQWTSGAQPNLDCLLQDWQPKRTLMCHDSGLAAADQVPHALEDAVAAGDARVFDLARLWGVDSWLVHKDWASDYLPPDEQVGPEVASSFMYGLASQPLQPVDRSSAKTISLPTGTPHVVFTARTAAAPKFEDDILTFGSLRLQANAGSGDFANETYFGLYDTQTQLWLPGAPLASGTTHIVSVSFGLGLATLQVDGVQQGLVLDCANNCRTTGDKGIPVNSSPSSIQLASHPSTGLQISVPSPSSSSELTVPTQSGPAGLTAALTTPELAVWTQAALPLVYSATSMTPLDSSTDANGLLAAAHRASTATAPVLLSSRDAAVVNSVDPNASTTWTADSPTSLHGVGSANGVTVLVFSQTFDPQWVLTVNGAPVPSNSHLTANGYANAWTVSVNGTFNWDLTYRPQSAVSIGIAVGVLLAGGSALFLLVEGARTTIRRWRRLRTAVHQPRGALD
jgi:hypothetical protein